MKQSGRVNWIVVTLLAIVLVLAALMVFSGESATSAAARFMTALSKGDVDGLADMSYFNPPRDRESVKKAWNRTLEIGKHYRFVWMIKSSKSPAPGRSSVTMEVTRDADKGTAYAENFSLDLIQQDGKWKVDTRSISRELYPALPR